MPPLAAPQEPPPTRDDVMNWDHLQLLEWLQSQNPVTFHYENELAAFKANRIGGSVFLQEKTAFFQSIGVPAGIARRLELLAEPFSGSSRKRKGEFDEGEPDPKKLFEDDSRKWAGRG
jgi:hypothetical protein